MAGAVTSFRLRAQTSMEQNQALVQRLMAQYGIFTVARPGPAAVAVAGSRRRYSPHLTTSTV
jgi:hypothetical protein